MIIDAAPVIPTAALSLPRIRNSEAEVFAQCRRKWDYSGALRRNLMATGNPVAALWFGTMFHFALEDYHGYHRFEHPVDAFTAAVNACEGEDEFPQDTWLEHFELGVAMLRYYADHWLPRIGDLQTLWLDGVPQVEVQWEMPFDGFVATGTFDRVCVDPFGRLVLMDYKTYREFDFVKLERDRQVSTYIWAARELYGRCEGLYHMQFRKVAPAQPKRLRNGDFSQDKTQGVVPDIYRQALIEAYGEVPDKYQSFLTYLALQVDENGDNLIRRQKATRTDEHLAHHEQAIRDQYREMVDKRTPIYPNPGFSCKTCPFSAPCLAHDLDADEEYLLGEKYVSRNTPTAWMRRLVWPDGTVGVPYERSR